MVVLDREGLRPMPEDLDLARLVRLDPERRALRARVAQERAEDQLDRGIRRRRPAVRVAAHPTIIFAGVCENRPLGWPAAIDPYQGR